MGPAMFLIDTATGCRQPPFLQELAAGPWVRCAGRLGRGLRVRRWLNVICTPLQHTAEGNRFDRVQRCFAFALFGAPVQWLFDQVTRGTAVVNRDGHAGLDVLAVRYDGRPAWLITRYWAWPLGHGHGRVVLSAVLDVADRSGALLVLEAGNPEVAHRIYGPAGFEFQPGQEHKRRPRIVREPVTSSATPCKMDRKLSV